MKRSKNGEKLVKNLQGFTSKVQVKTPLGDVDIERLTPNDKVISHDNKPHRIEEIHTTFYSGVAYQLTFVLDELQITPEQPLLIVNRNHDPIKSMINRDGASEDLIWVPAKNLRTNDLVSTLHGFVKIQDIKQVEINETIYNMRLCDMHTFLTNNCIVHDVV